MKKTSTTRPESIVPTEYGSTQFNYNIEETENGYTYDSVDAAGELTRSNIKFAMMCERYTPDEITQYENLHTASPKTRDLGVKAYFAVKTWVEDILDKQLDSEIQ